MLVQCMVIWIVSKPWYTDPYRESVPQGRHCFGENVQSSAYVICSNGRHSWRIYLTSVLRISCIHWVISLYYNNWHLWHWHWPLLFKFSVAYMTGFILCIFHEIMISGLSGCQFHYPFTVYFFQLTVFLLW